MSCRFRVSDCGEFPVFFFQRSPIAKPEKCRDRPRISSTRDRREQFGNAWFQGTTIWLLANPTHRCTIEKLRRAGHGFSGFGMGLRRIEHKDALNIIKASLS
jgi:hypothetical protein